MKSLLVTVCLIYLGICLALFVLQRKILYFPVPATISGDLPENVEVLSFDTDGETLQGWIVNKGQAKALVYYGGNAENIEQNIEFFNSIKTGYSIYLIPYRGYGESTGKPSESKLYQDALYIFDQLSQQHRSMSLMGRSLGTGVATYVAAQRKVENLVLVTPFDSIENVAKNLYWMLPVSLLIRDKYNSLERASSMMADHILILIAEQDEVIPRARTENLIQQLGNRKLESKVIKGAGHNDISLYPEFSLSIRGMLK